MDHLNFANHLGFSTWDDLIESSECVAVESDRTWYMVQTSGWYKWVVWNTNFDMYFNHKTRDEALCTVKWLFEKFHIDYCKWCVTEPYSGIASVFLGTTDSPLQ